MSGDGEIAKDNVSWPQEPHEAVDTWEGEGQIKGKKEDSTSLGY